jgi:preprotein translocase subunit SecA
MLRRRSFSHPPATRSLRPEKRDRKTSAVDRAARAAVAPLARFVHSCHRTRWIAAAVAKYGTHVSRMGDLALREEAARLGQEVRKRGFRDDLVAHLFALVREVSGRTVGLRHFDTQLMGGLVLLKGMVAEMETGEGKTLTATLAASTAALAGIPVHVICVNEYLTARDADDHAALCTRPSA